jgi:hypothetical protein
MQWSGLSGNESTIIVWMRLQWATHWPPQNQNQNHDSCFIHRGLESLLGCHFAG